MVRKLLFVILSLVTALPAGAAAPLRSHMDYLLATPAQQRESVVKIMELFVALEARYERDTKTYGYSKNRFEKYSKMLETISSFFISPAYAACTKTKTPMNSWDDYKRAFEGLKGLNNTCVFAGWMSTTRFDRASGKTLCSHPDLSAHNSRVDPNQCYGSVGITYPKPNLTQDPECLSKPGESKIQCNPLIFGYKSMAQGAENGKLFCVDGNSQYENAAYKCMERATTETVNGFTPDQRLGFLAKKMKDPGTFNNIHSFVMKMCVCKDNGPKLNKEYIDVISEHKTCYGIMKMMSSLADKCEADATEVVAQRDLFENFNNYFRNKSFSDSNAFNAEYASFKNQLQGDLGPAYTNLCFNASCESAEFKDNKCTVTYKKGGETLTSEPMDCNPQQGSVRVDIPGVGPLSCSVNTPEVPQGEYTCSAKCAEAVTEGKRSCEIEVTAPEGADPVEKFTESLAVENDKVTIPKSKFKAGLEGNAECPVTPPDAVKYVCKTANCVTAPDNSKYICNGTLEKETPAQGDQPVAFGPIDVTLDSKEGKTFNATAQVDGKPVSATCSDVSFPEVNNTVEAPKFKLITKCEGTNPTCTVTIEKDGEKSIDDWTPEWNVKNKPADVAEVTPTGKNATVPRSISADYDVCAKLKKDGQADLAEQCGKITKVPAPAPTTAPTTRPPMRRGVGGALPVAPQPMMRGRADTSAMGIN